MRRVAQRGPFEPPVPSRPWKTIVFHHSATPAGSVASIDAEHRLRKDSAGEPWLGIGYHFVIGNGVIENGHGMPDGKIEATFRWQQQLPGAHAGSRTHNASGIGICLIGNFNEAPPTKKQISSARKLVESLRRRYLIDREQVIAHRDVRATDCPGRFFPFDQMVLAPDRANP
ncbi:MAG: N-acetylmuramoyl-L-alanine amidase [Planctomycetes bacterium]|nr:N-acetylmuramoyl-L-alanine amidase [Planctomycetota bacterium]